MRRRCEAMPLELDCGGVYLLHFEPGLHHARHYLGVAVNVGFRLGVHAVGGGSPLVAAVLDGGGSFVVARLWRGAGRRAESTLKRQHSSVRLCPLCSGRGAYARGKL